MEENERSPLAFAHFKTFVLEHICSYKYP